MTKKSDAESPRKNVLRAQRPMTGHPSVLRKRLEINELKPSNKEAPDAIFVNVNDLVTNKYVTIDHNKSPSKFASTLASKPFLAKTEDTMIDRIINNNCFSLNNLETVDVSRNEGVGYYLSPEEKRKNRSLSAHGDRDRSRERVNRSQE